MVCPIIGANVTSVERAKSMKHSGYRNFNICWRNLRITLKIVLLAHSFARIAVSPWPIQEWRLQGDLPPTMRLAVRAGVTLIYPRIGIVELDERLEVKADQECSDI